MSIRVVISIFIVLIITSCCYPEKQTVSNKLMSVLPKNTQMELEGSLVKYCPDNTCYIFKMSSTNEKIVLQKFSLVFLYYFGDYYALSDWKKDDSTIKNVESVLSQWDAKNCKQKTKRGVANCMLSTIAAENQISVFQRRYDENTFTDLPVNLEKLAN